MALKCPQLISESKLCIGCCQPANIRLVQMYLSETPIKKLAGDYLIVKTHISPISQVFFRYFQFLTKCFYNLLSSFQHMKTKNPLHTILLLECVNKILCLIPLQIHYFDEIIQTTSHLYFELDILFDPPNSLLLPSFFRMQSRTLLGNSYGH